MKNKCMGLIAVFFLFVMGVHAQELEKQIIGKWCNPYTYKSSGELKGFEFKKGGKCEAINIPSLELKSWEIKDGKLIIKGLEVQEDGKKVPYETEERISKLNRDSLTLVVQEQNPRLEFLYLNTKVIKKKVENNE